MYVYIIQVKQKQTISNTSSLRVIATFINGKARLLSKLGRTLMNYGQIYTVLATSV